MNTLILWLVLLPATLWGSTGLDTLPPGVGVTVPYYIVTGGDIGSNVPGWRPLRTNDLPAPHYTVLRWGWLGGVSASFVGGAAWGLHEATMHHWDAFHQRFPNADPQIWNPRESWLNKYKGRDPANGRTNVPVVFTDIKHLLASTALASGFVAGASFTIGERRPWWHYGLDFLAGSAAWWVGNRLTFNWIYP